MKKLYYLYFAILLTSLCSAQSNTINYKALIKDGSGNVLANQTISVQFSILQGVAQTNVYQETHTPTTDANGLIILNIGSGTTSDVFTNIDWGSDSHFLNVQIDSSGGSTYVDMGTTEFMTVPYALTAQTVLGAAFKTESGVTGNTALNDDYIFGSSQLDDDANALHQKRIVFDKSKGAFRAGSATSTEWDDTNRGFYSTALGYNTTASANSSTAIGDHPIASGSASTAFGYHTTSSAFASTSLGRQTIASGQSSTSLGHFTEAKSFGQTTIGINNTNTETPNSTFTFNASDRLFVIGNGVDESNKSDALVMLKNGNTQLNGLLTLDDNNGNGFTLPNVDGTINQVLQTDGTGNVSWSNLPTVSPFSNTASVINGGGSNDDYVFGSTQLDDDGLSIHEKRILFDKSKGAFRAGYVSDTQWDDANRGFFSTALGGGTIASGDSSTALGSSTKASGSVSTALGNNTTSSGNSSTALGYITTASGNSSTAMGRYTEAKSFGQTTIGLNSTNTETPNSTTGFNTNDRLFVIGNGLDDTNRSDAFVMIKNGNTQLNGQLTLDDNNGNGFTLPNVDGATNQILQTDGTGTVTWNNIPTPTPSPFSNTASVISGGDSNDDYVFGSSQLDYDGDTTHNQRIIFDKSKGAFRAGTVSSPAWDDSNRGLNSIAMGTNTTASGLNSTAFGSLTTASGTTSTTFGLNTTASNFYTTAMGANTVASGTTATALGGNTTASGNSATSLGGNTTASGNYSTAMGRYTEAKSFGQTTIGLYNTNTQTPNSTTAFDANDRLFVIGNGSNTSNRRDALVMFKNGNAQLNGQLTFDDNNGNGFTLPNIDGTANQVLLTNGSGDVSWSDLPIPTPSPFSNSANLIRGGDADDDFVFGSSQFNNDLLSIDDDYKFFFDKSSGAFRAGYSSNTQWNDINRGIGSIGFGRGTMAKGTVSSSFGFETNADSYGSFTIGKHNIGGGNPTTWITTDPLFEIGIGNDDANRSNALTVLKNGNVGLGVSTPGYNFAVAGSANLNSGISTGQALWVNGDEALWYDGANFSWGFGGTSNYFANMVGIGENTPNYMLDVKDTQANTYVAHINNLSTDINADGLRIRLGKSSPNTGNYFIGFVGGSTTKGRIAGNGTGVSYNTTSDGRLKTNIVDLANALDVINHIQPRTYEFKTNLGVTEYGFIAQELQPVYPQAVSGDPNGNVETDPMMVDYSRLTPILTAGIKELNSKVKSLEQENKNLKQQLAKYESLEARLTALEKESVEKDIITVPK